MEHVGRNSPPDMPDALRNALNKLAIGGRILDREGHGSRAVGHLALRDPDGRGFWLKRSGIGLDEVADWRDFILLAFDGKRMAGNGRRHVEWPIHAEILKARPDLSCTGHTHPYHARVFSACTVPLRAVSSPGANFLHPPPRFTLTSDLITTVEEGIALAQCLGDNNAAFLRNHGVVFCGATIADAVMSGIYIEEACREQLAVGASGFPWEWPDETEHAAKFRKKGANNDNFFDYYSRQLAKPADG
mgnify:CR=1 FL=1